MSHNREIIIDAVTPQVEGALVASEVEPEYEVRVTYRPGHAATPAQIGNEVARIQRRINQIIEGTPD